MTGFRGRTRHLFSYEAARDPKIGVEVEMLAFDADTHAVARLDGRLGIWLDMLERQSGWRHAGSGKGAPKLVAPNGTLTLEPGGQVEFSSIPQRDPLAVARDVERTMSRLSASAESAGIELMGIGIDPYNALDDAPLQIHGDRYDRMDAFFRAVCPEGLRMMRQTAAVQVNIDAAFEPQLTWTVLNRAAPLLTAIFANSRSYAGEDTGWASYRAKTWLGIDPTRTGVHGSELSGEPWREYDAFALNARSIRDAPAYRTFREQSHTDEAAWADHLTTLFPDVRPRSFYEVRSIDAMAPERVVLAILLIWGLSRDVKALHDATDALPAVDDEMRVKAARDGMLDARIGSLARALTEIAASGCRRALPHAVDDADALTELVTDQSRREVRRSKTTSSATIM